MSVDTNGAWTVGQRVRVTESVIVYHHPEHRGQAFDAKGQEGEVVDVILDWHGRPVSANLPVLVKFSKRFKAHFRSEELEAIE